MAIATTTILLILPVFLIILGGFVYLFLLLIRALRKYLGSKEVRQEKAVTKKALGEVLREHRTRLRMTQEFVAESLGVSRQAVSKWERANPVCPISLPWQSSTALRRKRFCGR